MKKKAPKTNHLFLNGARKAVGIFLILMGIIGLFVPILQGFALILAGILLLQNKFLLKKLKQMRTHFRKRAKK